MYCTSPHREVDRQVERAWRPQGWSPLVQPSSSAAAAGKLPLHWPEMPSRAGLAQYHKLLLLVAASVVSSANVIRPYSLFMMVVTPSCGSHWAHSMYLDNVTQAACDSTVATPGELAWGGSLWRMGPTFFRCFLLTMLLTSRGCVDTWSFNYQ